MENDCETLYLEWESRKNLPNWVGYKSVNQPEKRETMTEKKLYEIKQGEQTLYGHKLAVNSQGLWVMEVKGSGDIIAVDKASVEEVLPHTISVSFTSTGKYYSYFAPAGKYKVGEYYLIEANSGRVIVKVEAVDTKSRAATVELSVIGRLVLEDV